MSDKRQQLLQHPESYTPGGGSSQGHFSSPSPKTELLSSMNTFSKEFPTNSFGVETKSISSFPPPSTSFSYPTESFPNPLFNPNSATCTLDSFHQGGTTQNLPNFTFGIPIMNPTKLDLLPMMNETPPPPLAAVKQQSISTSEVSLSEDEIHAFQAPCFSFQRIPEHAPPLEWCT